MSIQSIIKYASTIEIDRRRVIGVQTTRNQQQRITETVTLNPWKFIIEVAAALPYNQARSIIEQLDQLDRGNPEIIQFSHSGMTWLFDYQGAMSPAQVQQITVAGFTGNQLILQNLPTISQQAVMFERGDILQIGSNPHPLSVRSQVLRGTNNTVTITTHRNNFLGSVANQSITVGNDCSFRVFCPNMPVYRLLPGAFYYNSLGEKKNGARIEWSDSFRLQEWIE